MDDVPFVGVGDAVANEVKTKIANIGVHPHQESYTIRKGCGADEVAYKSTSPDELLDAKARLVLIGLLPIGAMGLTAIHLYLRRKQHIQDIFVNNAIVAFFCMLIEVGVWFVVVSPNHSDMLRKKQRDALAGDHGQFMYQHPSVDIVEGTAKAAKAGGHGSVRDRVFPLAGLLTGPYAFATGPILFVLILASILGCQSAYTRSWPQVGMSLTNAALSAAVWTTCQLIAHKVMFSQTYKGLINKIAGRVTSVQHAAYCSGLLTKDQLNAMVLTMGLMPGFEGKACSSDASQVGKAVAQEGSSESCQAVASKHLSKAGQGIKARYEKAKAAQETATKAVADATGLTGVTTGMPDPNPRIVNAPRPVGVGGFDRKITQAPHPLLG